jgi:hypothetical protein
MRDTYFVSQIMLIALKSPKTWNQQYFFILEFICDKWIESSVEDNNYSLMTIWKTKFSFYRYADSLNKIYFFR